MAAQFCTTVRILPILAVVLMACSGCVSGSLATDTGWSGEGDWSAAPVQDAHVGEDISFSFILREPFSQSRLALAGVADYAAFHIHGERAEADADYAGNRFELTHRLVDIEPQRTLAVTAEAFRIQGTRDHMKIRGRWHRAVEAADQPDQLMGKDAIKLRAYQCRIDHAFPEPSTGVDWTTARLVIARRDAQLSTVFLDKPNRVGFTLSGPDSDGLTHVQYEPTAEQINKTGTTQATFHFLDTNGVPHTSKFEFDTP